MSEEPNLTQPEEKKNSKLVWIIGGIALAMVIAVGVVFAVTRQTTIKTTSSAECPAANKQHPGHCIRSNVQTLELQPNKAVSYQFAILDDNSQPIKDFETVHERKMHVMVVRKDLAYFQHIHPTFNSQTGIWTLDALTLPTDGPYRLFADFTEAGDKAPITIYEDLVVGDMNNYKAQPLAQPQDDKTFGVYQALLQTDPLVVSANAETKLSYLLGDAQNGGQSLSGLEPYLGAMGHAVIFSENLDFIHAHATDDMALAARGIVDFKTRFPKEGNYKIFAQFQRAGDVFTTDFVVPVYKNLSPADQRINSGDDVHSGH